MHSADRARTDEVNQRLEGHVARGTNPGKAPTVLCNATAPRATLHEACLCKAREGAAVHVMLAAVRKRVQDVYPRASVVVKVLPTEHATCALMEVEVHVHDRWTFRAVDRALSAAHVAACSGPPLAARRSWCGDPYYTKLFVVVSGDNPTPESVASNAHNWRVALAAQAWTTDVRDLLGRPVTITWECCCA